MVASWSDQCLLFPRGAGALQMQSILNNTERLWQALSSICWWSPSVWTHTKMSLYEGGWRGRCSENEEGSWDSCWIFAGRSSGQILEKQRQTYKDGQMEARRETDRESKNRKWGKEIDRCTDKQAVFVCVWVRVCVLGGDGVQDNPRVLVESNEQKHTELHDCHSPHTHAVPLGQGFQLTCYKQGPSLSPGLGRCEGDQGAGLCLVHCRWGLCRLKLSEDSAPSQSRGTSS